VAPGYKLMFVFGLFGQKVV